MRALIVIALLAASAHADPLSPEDLARKNEDGYFTGLPLFAFSTDIGFGAGARAYYYYDGKRDDPRFATTPYLYRMFLQGFASTGGIQFHYFDFDAPKIGGSPYRIRSQLIYQRNTNQHFFGLGSASLQPLSFPGTGQSYRNYNDYYDDQQKTYAGGQTFAKYDQIDEIRPLWIASIERLFDDDRVRVLGGFGFTYTKINDYSGKMVDIAGGGQAIEAPTRFATDCAAGKVVGCNGGWDNFLRLGISYDTRDFEPDPNKGVFIDSALDAGTVALGSDYDYLRFLIALRGYYSPLADHDVVLAARFAVVAQTSGTPFYSMDTFPFTEDPHTGLGGHRTLRGYRQDRFVGPIMTVANAEVRWTWGHLQVLGQKLAFIVVPFYDIGRPYDHLIQLGEHDWQSSYGAAFRVTWNLATVVTVDYGVSHEDTGFYINFNHIF